MELFLNPSTDPAFNLALEELIASDYGQEVCMLWRNSSAIIVGRNQNTEAEIDADFVRRHSIAVVRRITGGGAVYHDLGNVNYTIAAADRQLDPEAFARNAQPILEALRSFGIPAEFSGRNDILVNGKKISGSAKSVLASRTLFHGTLLFDVDLSLLSCALKPDPEKIRAKGIASVRARVANLKEFLPAWDRERFLAELSDSLLAGFHLAAPSPIPETLWQKAEDLAETKYRSWDWNYGRSPAAQYTKSARFPCGTICLSFNVEHGLIRDTSLTGDFFGGRPVEELAEKWNGLLPRQTEIRNMLQQCDLAQWIQGITWQELMTLVDLS